MSSTIQQAPKPKAARKRAVKPSTNDNAALAHETIAQRARELYEEAGSPGGRDVEFWLEAERRLRAEQG